MADWRVSLGEEDDELELGWETESGECWNKGKKRKRKKKYIYYFNERDNKIYYLILTFELPCTAINSCTLQLSR